MARGNSGALVPLGGLIICTLIAANAFGGNAKAAVDDTTNDLLLKGGAAYGGKKAIDAAAKRAGGGPGGGGGGAAGGGTKTTKKEPKPTVPTAPPATAKPTSTTARTQTDEERLAQAAQPGRAVDLNAGGGRTMSTAPAPTATTRMPQCRIVMGLDGTISCAVELG